MPTFYLPYRRDSHADRACLDRSCTTVTFITFLAAPRTLVTFFFYQQISRCYCITLFAILGTFEPYRIAARAYGDRPSSDLARNIQLEVRQDTDTYVLSSQAAKAGKYGRKYRNGIIKGQEVIAETPITDHSSSPDFLVLEV
jgi:hypothetical protein